MLKKIFFFSLLIMITGNMILLAQTPTPTPTPTNTRTSPPYYPFYLSFASDDNDNGPTFWRLSSSSFGSEETTFNLILDRNGDYYGGQVIFESIMSSVISINSDTYYYYNLTNGNYLHTWLVNGYLQFNLNDPPENPEILKIEFDNALLTSYSPDITKTGETMTLEVSESVDSTINFAQKIVLEQINLWPVDFEISEDFAITFTNVRINDNEDECPDINGYGYFDDSWKAEGSFSASANTYPSTATSAP